MPLCHLIDVEKGDATCIENTTSDILKCGMSFTKLQVPTSTVEYEVLGPRWEGEVLLVGVLRQVEPTAT